MTSWKMNLRLSKTIRYPCIIGWLITGCYASRTAAFSVQIMHRKSPGADDTLTNHVLRNRATSGGIPPSDLNNFIFVLRNCCILVSAFCLQHIPTVSPASDRIVYQCFVRRFFRSSVRQSKNGTKRVSWVSMRKIMPGLLKESLGFSDPK